MAPQLTSKAHAVASLPTASEGPDFKPIWFMRRWEEGRSIQQQCSTCHTFLAMPQHGKFHAMPERQLQSEALALAAGTPHTTPPFQTQGPIWSNWSSCPEANPTSPNQLIVPSVSHLECLISFVLSQNKTWAWKKRVSLYPSVIIPQL